MGVNFPPFERIEGDRSRGLILVCDHASNALPPEYGDLGLPSTELARHIAYDIGARAVTLELAARLGVPAVLSTFSRLLIDPNRGEDDPTIVMRLSDGTVIPGNHPITEREIAGRIERFHRPYHAAIAGEIDACIAQGTIPAIFSVHSFTPSWKAFRRPWQVGLLWDRDPRYTLPLLEMLRAVPGLTVGDNEPYDGALRNDTLFRHATMRGLAHTLIEIRQDLIGHEAGVERWCDLLCPMLESINGLAELHEVRHFGSRTGPVDRVGGAEPSQRGRRVKGMTMDEKTKTELEAAAFRELVAHLRRRTDVQNIDMMNLAGFCRNCLSRWYQEAAEKRGIVLDKAAAREIIYGMPYDEWTARYQTEASDAQKQAFAKANPGH